MKLFSNAFLIKNKIRLKVKSSRTTTTTTKIKKIPLEIQNAAKIPTDTVQSSLINKVFFVVYRKKLCRLAERQMMIVLIF